MVKAASRVMGLVAQGLDCDCLLQLHLAAVLKDLLDGVVQLPLARAHAVAGGHGRRQGGGGAFLP